MEYQQKFINGKIELLDRDIDSWSSALQILDDHPSIKETVLPDYRYMRIHIEKLKNIKTALLDVMIEDASKAAANR